MAQHPGAVPKPLNEFDILRRKAKQRSATATQGQQEALQRKLAATGNLQSGAAIKLQQQTAQAGARATEEATQSIDFAQAQQRRQQQEIIKQREFQSGEALKGREFQRDFQGGQADLQRKFIAGESALGRNQQAQQFGQQFGLQQETFKSNQAFREAEFNATQSQNALQNLLNLNETNINPFEVDAALNRVAATLAKQNIRITTDPRTGLPVVA